MRFSRCWGVLLLAQSLAAQARFSVEQALSAPFSNQLTAAPEKQRVAWFTDAEGHRNVWVAGPHEQARQVTHFEEDDGQDIDDITWSRDAERIGWTHGTGAQGSEHAMAANPAELPGPVKQKVEVADLRNGSVRVVAEGHAPLFVADGSAILFLRSGSIWIAELGTEKAPRREGPPRASWKPVSLSSAGRKGELRSLPIGVGEAVRGSEPNVRQLVFVRGGAHGMRISPDGKLLAFVSERGDHSFIGVYAFATGKLQWMDPGTGMDHDPAWSPDGKRIAFVREVPIVSPIAGRWMRSGTPWSIRVAQIASGEGTEAWHADPGAGSLFHAVNATDQLIWQKDGRIVFPWEKGGWTRLYALETFPVVQNPNTVPKPPRLLTPGNLEVDQVASSGAAILVSANGGTAAPDDIDRRHVWSVDLHPGGTMLALKTGAGIETAPAILSDGTPAMLQGNASVPLVPYIQNEFGKFTELAPQLIPAEFPRSFVVPEPVLFEAADGMRIHGQLFLPRDREPGQRLPAVVFFHGGSRRQMLLGFHPMQYYAQAYEFNQYLASRGFAVLSVNYRSGVGYGLDFRQALHYGANGGSEYNDVVGAARYLQSRKDIDPKHIGAWGGSYGGYLTALALARSSDLYAAGVDLHGVHDWSLELDLWKPTSEPWENQAEIAKRAFDSSPMADVARWKSPVLLIQGDDDRNVLFSQTVRLAAELRKHGVHVEEKVFPDEVHDFLLHRNWLESYRLSAKFLEENLSGR